MQRELHILAAFVHGMLTGLHLLGIAYNVRRRNWNDVGVHLAGTIYSTRAVLGHHRDAQE